VTLDIFKAAQKTIRHVQKEEHRWFKQGDPLSPTLPWMPFQPAEFLSILFECVPELAGREFLDVGCGPGTKMRLARDFFGLEPVGIEINPAMAAEARAWGSVTTADALELGDGAFGAWDLIWLYRPFRDPQLETQLEARIMDEMKPGAILAGAHWEICPADHRWIPVFDDWEIRRGAWMKPRPVDDVPLP
jgi:SAM-dependent methyltransferase